MKLDKIKQILKKEHGIDINKVDDNKEILNSLTEISQEDNTLSKDLILAKLTEEEKTLITKMYESAELIERILNKTIRGIEKKIETYKKTKQISEKTKEKQIKKLKYDKEKIEELATKSKKMIRETSIIIPILRRNEKENDLIKIVAGKARDEELEKETAETNEKLKEIIENIKSNKGE